MAQICLPGDDCVQVPRGTYPIVLVWVERYMNVRCIFALIYLISVTSALNHKKYLGRGADCPHEDCSLHSPYKRQMPGAVLDSSLSLLGALYWVRAWWLWAVSPKSEKHCARLGCSHKMFLRRCFSLQNRDRSCWDSAHLTHDKAPVASDISSFLFKNSQTRHALRHEMHGLRSQR